MLDLNPVMDAQDEAAAIWMEITETTGGCVGRKYAKSVGVVTTPVIRQHLMAHGFSVSERDVFIRGLPLEIDLLVTTPNAKPAHGVIYDPSDVLVALEIERSGASSTTAAHMKDACLSICGLVGAVVPCAYVTLQERTGHKHHPKECDEFQVFCLFWHTGERDRSKPNISEDWGRLLDWLGDIVQPDSGQ